MKPPIMARPIRSKAIQSAVGILAAVVLFLSAGIGIPLLDAHTDAYFRGAITKAGVAYATCRVVNATVSVVKESHIELEPAGIGISLAAGQLLDPIDDMSERLSDVLVTAITSLGVQKLAHEIFISLAAPILSVLVLALSILLWFDYGRIAPLKRITLKIAVIVVIARICLPISSAANSSIYTHFFADRIEAANEALSLVSAQLDALKEFTVPEIDGVLGTIENSATVLKQKTKEFNAAVQTIADNMGAIIENLLSLTFIYVAIFLIQVILLPLLTFWLLVKVVNSLFQSSMPVLLHHRPPPGGALPHRSSGDAGRQGGAA